MTEFRILDHNWHTMAGHAFCSEYAIRITGSIAETLKGAQYGSFWGNLRPGDSIRIVSFEDDGYTQVREVGQAMVTHVGDIVGLLQVGEIIKVPAARPEPVMEEEAVLHVKRGFAGEFLVKDGEGNTLESFKSKQAAEDYVQGAM